MDIVDTDDGANVEMSRRKAQLIMFSGLGEVRLDSVTLHVGSCRVSRFTFTCRCKGAKVCKTNQSHKYKYIAYLMSTLYYIIDGMESDQRDDTGLSKVLLQSHEG